MAHSGVDAGRAVVALGSGSEDLIPTFLEQIEQIAPGLPIYVVSEFAPPRGHWIPFYLGRTLEQNRARIQDALRGKQVEFAALILQPRQPFWGMRRLAFRLGARRILCFNENLDHFALHPRSAITMLKHLVWRTGNLIRWETRPGGWMYTQVWRLFHPWAFVRPLVYRLAVRPPKRVAAMERLRPLERDLSEGVSVVIPSRNGRDLLTRLLPGLLAERPSEVIVVDSGSDDGTRAWLDAEYPSVRCVEVREPLSFAAAVNHGIAQARFAYTLTLNNDMVIEAPFLSPLRAAFDAVPDLFCATAQIFFPPGQRREETGKAVFRAERQPGDYPVWCVDPLPAEDHSYVLYGSGGCSLYNTAKLRALGGFDEAFTPAYVEDHDLGWRGWQQGWPTVFVAGARLVHYHRSTSKRYFKEKELALALERNHLKHLLSSVCDEQLFAELWREAIVRLNWLAAQEPPPPFALPALKVARRLQSQAPSRAAVDERHIMAIGCGEAAHFPGRAARGRPVVLVASPYVPFPLSHGGAVRMFNLTRRAADDFDQVLLAFCDELQTPAPELLELFIEVVLVRRRGSHLRPLTDRPDVVEEHDSAVFRAEFKELLRKHKPGLVQLEFTQMAVYARDCGGIPSILVEHDITLDLYAQLLAQNGDWETRQQLERWQWFERAAWREVNCVVAMSEKDRLAVDGARRVEMLPNGVDLERFQPAQGDPEPRRILFIGSFAHLPNLMALDFFLREAWPELEAAGARLHIIAGARSDHYRALYQDRIVVNLERPGIEVEGFVSDVRPAYRRAEAVIAPLLASAGTNIKVMEAMAMGRVVVATPAGINGLALSPGHDVVVEETGSGLARALLELFADPARRRALEAAARATVEREFGWDAIAQRQAALYRDLLRPTSSPRTSR